jgi:hypothetical protein
MPRVYAEPVATEVVQMKTVRDVTSMRQPGNSMSPHSHPAAIRRLDVELPVPCGIDEAGPSPAVALWFDPLLYDFEQVEGVLVGNRSDGYRFRHVNLSWGLATPRDCSRSRRGLVFWFILQL